MTYREKLKIERPDRVGANYVGGCSGCPGDFWKGAPTYHSGCGPNACASCWNQEEGADPIIALAKRAINALYGLHIESKQGVPKIKNVMFNDPATIIFWEDGTKTVVKAQDETFDKEKGLAMAISKKAMGNKGSYCNEFKKWLK